MREVAPAEILCLKQDTSFSSNFLLAKYWNFFTYHLGTVLLVPGPIGKAQYSCHAGRLPDSPLHPQLDSLRLPGPHSHLRLRRSPGGRVGKVGQVPT